MTTEPRPEGNEADAQGSLQTALKTARLIHLALVAGLVTFGGVVLVLSHGRLSLASATRSPIFVVAALVCAGSLCLASVVPVFYRKAVPAPKDVHSALRQYQACCLVRWALIEGGALFAAVAALVTRNILPLGLFAICLVMLACRYPSQREFVAFFADVPRT